MEFIKDKILEINHKLEGVIDNPEEEHIFVMGSTGGGKSVLTWKLIGGKINVQQVRNTYHSTIIEGSVIEGNISENNFPKFGNSQGRSCTNMP